MARQTELLNMLVQAQLNQQQQFRGGRDDRNPPVASYQDFLSTQPPFFSKAEEPLDADAWLHIIESKFTLLTIPCADSSKASFAAQQLRGAARIWWDNFYAMQPAGMNSGSPFERIIFPQDCWNENLMSSWLLLKVPIQFCSTHRISIICASMQGIMQIMIPRNKTASVGA
jgi:hypothetical protein